MVKAGTDQVTSLSGLVALLLGGQAQLVNTMMLCGSGEGESKYPSWFIKERKRRLWR